MLHHSNVLLRFFVTDIYVANFVINRHCLSVRVSSPFSYTLAGDLNAMRDVWRCLKFVLYCFATLYKSLVKSHLEFANSVWYPKRETDVDKLE